jgi:hypothetical protein
LGTALPLLTAPTSNPFPTKEGEKFAALSSFNLTRSNPCDQYRKLRWMRNTAARALISDAL